MSFWNIKINNNNFCPDSYIKYTLSIIMFIRLHNVSTFGLDIVLLWDSCRSPYTRCKCMQFSCRCRRPILSLYVHYFLNMENNSLIFNCITMTVVLLYDATYAHCHLHWCGAKWVRNITWFIWLSGQKYQINFSLYLFSIKYVRKNKI